MVDTVTTLPSCSPQFNADDKVIQGMELDAYIKAE